MLQCVSCPKFILMQKSYFHFQYSLRLTKSNISQSRWPWKCQSAEELQPLCNATDKLNCSHSTAAYSWASSAVRSLRSGVITMTGRSDHHQCGDTAWNQQSNYLPAHRVPRCPPAAAVAKFPRCFGRHLAPKTVQNASVDWPIRMPWRLRISSDLRSSFMMKIKCETVQNMLNSYGQLRKAVGQAQTVMQDLGRLTPNRVETQFLAALLPSPHSALFFSSQMWWKI